MRILDPLGALLFYWSIKIYKIYYVSCLKRGKASGEKVGGASTFQYERDIMGLEADWFLEVVLDCEGPRITGVVGRIDNSLRRHISASKSRDIFLREI
jgi:hypothetical protein